MFFHYIYSPPNSNPLEKNQFHILVNNFTSLSSEETEQLISLQKEYPYSQIIYSLAARASADNQLNEKENQLHLSAIYSTDRAVLKSIMTALQKERKINLIKKESKVDVVVEKKIEIPVEKKPKEITTEPVSVPAATAAIEKTIEPSIADLSGDALYDEIMRDVERLKELKLQFEQVANGLSFPEVKSTRKTKISDPDEGLLQEIKTSKKRIKPEGPKQKEQIEIIDQFIKSQPGLIRGKSTPAATTTPAEREDLSDPNETYGENVVSETLVHILLKQGKKEKAVEVLKKLIWKFPQKKAYFAAQIEDLKK